ncbi:MAG: hypothetical protein A3D56_00360 [Candidatus Taylorbacteria bacterium RIFCSPHIGHO2_02_FULL_45_35]|uniref:Fatty acid desaturase domain-containing protein n=1 Tax=Candidatus Taylorbacteria bacterium RIFCSPHIGHO2_02_FULL_45_35 TaxID=1802311 RepID=A0A1G2MTT3_9BACT|nr:MAG: hypothetical protein A3D56_00360 [Candidatus Taylorbacteria bacterium RIFCSPHIGHO2_02_FULL_45_35]OHA33185.1 MAG: hypothetical protein A3A22_00105 [Candidatus Taylorbacteria bacterium RIFCSPLOWO2_01_FULL_45_34b]
MNPGYLPLDLTWWQLAIIFFIITHITMLSITIYLHRHQTHGALELHPTISHFFRFWLWLTSGMGTKEWVAVHRKHHAKVETADDPHSPHVKGIVRILFFGVIDYRREATNKETLECYGEGTPEDYPERNLYRKYTFLGTVILLLLEMAILGIGTGAIFWFVQMLWVPFWAAGVVNGLGHFVGYRRHNTPDDSRNMGWLLGPLGLIISLIVVGEENHNNHHARQWSAKLSHRWFELDIGWLYIRLLAFLRLARNIRAVA